MSPKTESGRADSESINQEAELCDDSRAVWDCGSVPGELNTVHVESEMVDDPIQVKGIQESDNSKVGLMWTSGPVYAHTYLDPENARNLAALLETAADAAEDKID